jgi:lipoyl(octanoyl) transferase
MEIIDLGLIDHHAAEEIQLQRLNAILEGKGNEALYLLEHPPVITLGRQGGLENLILSEDQLEKQGIKVVKTRRGGNITCHYPGQLVVYPVMHIEKRRGGIKKFFSDMEETAIRTAKTFGVEAGRSEGRPGVWTEKGKLCSIGIGVRKWVTYHGLSFNISRDMSLFNAINLCGLKGAHPTSLSLEAGRDIDILEVKNVFKQEFRRIFENTTVAQG